MSIHLIRQIGFFKNLARVFVFASLILSGVCAVSAPSAKNTQSSAAFDEPNRDFEERLSRIYKRSSLMPEEKWDAMVMRQRSEAFKVRKGSTLSGISMQLFGDQSYWPKLWSENGMLENPHVISPGRQIHFSPGTEEDAPSISLIDPSRAAAEIELPAPSYESDPAETDDGAAAAVAREPKLTEPAIPLPDQQGKRKLELLPKSFVSQQSPTAGGYDASGVEVIPNKARNLKAAQIVPAYWVERVPNGVGIVSEIEAGSNVASAQQNVFIKMQRPAREGEILSVVYPTGPAPGRHDEGGDVLEVGGVVQISEAVDQGVNLYRAMVIKNVGPIRKGSIVIDERLPRANFSRTGNVKSVEAKVVGGEYDHHRQALGVGATVFLDAGERKGLAPGDLLAIKSRRASRRPESAYPDLSTVIAVAKIVHAQANGSTAFIIESQEEVLPGDVTGGPLPPLPPRNIIAERTRIIDIDAETQRDRDRYEQRSLPQQ